MTRKIAAIASTVGLFAATHAWAQYSNVSYSRPSSEAPSTRVGRVGGVATRGGVSEVSRGQAAGGGFYSPFTFGFAGGRVQSAAGFVVGAQIRAGARPSARFGARSLGGQSISGFDSYAQVVVPWMGTPTLLNDRIDAAYFAPAVASQTFEEYFQLGGGTSTAAPEPQAPFETLSDALFAVNQEVLRDRQGRALAVFRQAMTPSADAAARDAQIHQAMLLLDLLVKGGARADLPELLMVHGAMERLHDFEAVSHLLSLVQNNPKAFEQKPDLTSFFPEPKVLEDQLRARLRVGDESGNWAGAYVLQAYCCWMLGENGRAQAALRKAHELNAGVEADLRIRAAAQALAAAAR